MFRKTLAALALALTFTTPAMADWQNLTPATITTVNTSQACDSITLKVDASGNVLYWIAHEGVWHTIEPWFLPETPGIGTSFTVKFQRGGGDWGSQVFAIGTFDTWRSLAGQVIVYDCAYQMGQKTVNIIVTLGDSQQNPLTATTFTMKMTVQ